MFSKLSGRALACVLGAGALVLGLAGPAAAHVTVVPEEATQGGYAKLTFRVPNESDTAGTVRVRVDLPADTPLSSVRTKSHQGWQVDTKTTEFDEPVPVGDVDVEAAVTAVTWTAEGDVAIGAGEFEEFELSVGPLPETESLAFPAVQTYSDDTVVRWDQVRQDGTAEHPAPSLRLVASDGGDGHGAGDTGTSDTEPSSAEEGAGQAAQTSAVDPTARTLGATGLGVGVLSLIALVAVTLRRRSAGTSQ